MPLRTRVIEADLDVLSATALEAIQWGRTEFGDRLCVLSSMQETTVIDLAMTVDPAISVVFLDTGYHFPETLETVRRVERRYGIEVEVVPPVEPVRADIEPGRCCDQKVEQLDQALAARDAWITGIRRKQTAQRRSAPIIGWEPETDTASQIASQIDSQIDSRVGGRVKISPLAQWDDADIDAYRRANDLIRNPLLDQGYSSIGCRTCTTPTGPPGGADRPGETASTDARAGRWAGTERTECGLHTRR
jgi:phosphoadenosine phosphosulfate reductase